MVARAEDAFEAEIEQIKSSALAASRPLTDLEQERINELIVERAAAFRAHDAQRRLQYVRQQQDYWRAKDIEKLRGSVRTSPVFLALIGVFAASAVLLYRNPSGQLLQPLTIIFVLTGWIATVCIHEFGHAIVAYLGGDREVLHRGYLNLDPRRYTNPLLSIALPIVYILIGGFGLPGGSVMVNTDRLRSRNWELAVAIGGPAGTVACLILAGAPFILGADALMTLENSAFWGALGVLVRLLAIVLVLNLLPIPPLDGFRILSYWMSEGTRQKAYSLGWLPVLIFFFVILGNSNPISGTVWFAADVVTLMFPIPYWPTIEAFDLLSFR